MFKGEDTGEDDISLNIVAPAVETDEIQDSMVISDGDGEVIDDYDEEADDEDDDELFDDSFLDDENFDDEE